MRVARARRVVKIGTANGYSTVWFADAVCDTDGHVVSLDTATNPEAHANLARADAAQPGLAKRVELRQSEGGTYLAGLANGSVDLLFLDAERVEYAAGGRTRFESCLRGPYSRSITYCRTQMRSHLSSICWLQNRRWSEPRSL